MFDKTDFYRLSQAHYTFDRYVDSIIRCWYKEQYGDKPDFLYDDDGVIWKSDYNKFIDVKFSNGKEHKIPIEYFHSKKDYNGNDYPKIERLWYSNYYDGPLSGLALFNGVKVWYLCTEMDEIIDIRKFSIYEILPEQLEEIEHWHKLFQEMVGYHTDHGEMYKQYAMNPLTDDFYKLSKESERDVDCTNNKCLGVFDECYMT